MNSSRMKKSIVAGGLMWSCSLAATPAPHVLSGLVVMGPQRFDATIQRLLAREELKLLPIGNSQLFLIIPQSQDALVEEMQIRYLEDLISRLQKNEPVAD